MNSITMLANTGERFGYYTMLAIVVAAALCAQLYFLRPKTDNVE